MARYGQNSSGSGQAIVEGSCQHCNEPLDSIKTLGISGVTEHLLKRTQLHGINLLINYAIKRAIKSVERTSKTSIFDTNY